MYIVVMGCLGINIASAETSDTDSNLLDITPSFGFEYRTQFVGMRPLSLNDLTAEKVTYFDQRARVTSVFQIGKNVRIHSTFDLLDGVLFGDNGSFVGSPRRNRGSIVAAKNPSLARLNIGQIDESVSALDLDNYGYVLEEAEPLIVRTLFGEALTPIGLVRAGRQTLSNGRNVLIHDGSRINRWGISKVPDVVDGVAFATKLSAISDIIRGSKIDKSQDNGLFAAVLYGQIVENDPTAPDDLYQGAAAIFYRGKDLSLAGFDIPKIDSGVAMTNRSQGFYETDIYNVTGYFILEMPKFYMSVFHTQMTGTTREISEGLSRLGTRVGQPGPQDLAAFGGWVELAYRHNPFEFVFEFFYASGDDTPSVTDPINQLTFAQDTNVGLHLFENVLYYQTARSAARGVASLKALDAPTFPANEINTYGGLQNALVLFPQIIFEPLSWLSTRTGVMFAFSQRPVVDPVATILGSSGSSLDDDKVNFNGGKPGNYWGTEIDLGITIKPVPGFLIDIEGAYLFTGNAFWDENEDAVDSLFGNVRLTYYYDH